METESFFVDWAGKDDFRVRTIATQFVECFEASKDDTGRQLRFHVEKLMPDWSDPTLRFDRLNVVASLVHNLIGNDFTYKHSLRKTNARQQCNPLHDSTGLRHVAFTPFPEAQQVTLAHRVATQEWVGVCDVKYKRYGRALISTQRIQKDDIICDYHGEVITGVTWREYSEGIKDTSYCLEVPFGHTKRIINARSEICEAHRHNRCLGRFANHSLAGNDTSNVKLANITIASTEESVVVLKARRTIEPFEQLRFDYYDKSAHAMFKD